MSNDNFDSTKLYLDEIASIPLLSADEERELLTLSKKGDINSRNKLVEHNLRLVVSEAKDYVSPNVSLDDLISAGNEGLIKAINNFDLARGKRLSTYATSHIKKGVLDEVIKKTGVSAHYFWQYKNIKKVEEYFNHDNNRAPKNDEELLEYWKSNEEKIKLKAVAFPKTISKTREIIKNLSNSEMKHFEEKVNDDGEKTFLDFFAENTNDSIDTIEKLFFNNDISFLDYLTPIERLVIKSIGSYIINSKTSKASDLCLKDISVKLNLSNERVKEVYYSAVNRLRKLRVLK